MAEVFVPQSSGEFRTPYECFVTAANGKPELWSERKEVR
jgi:hypothetical protein